MYIEHFQEFVLLSKYLSISKASRELNLSQSSLSRHMKQLECDIGFSLFQVRSNKLVLTAAGQRFADKIDVLMQQLDAVLDECVDISRTQSCALFIDELPYPDEGSDAFFRLISECTKRNPFVTCTYAMNTRRTSRETLDSGEIDLAIVYRFGNTQETIDYFEQAGYRVRHLAAVPFGVWCSGLSSFAQRDTLRIVDLADVSVLQPNIPHSSFGIAIQQAFVARSIQKSPRLVNTNSVTEFLRYDDEEAIHLLPVALKNDFRMSNCALNICVPLDPADNMFHSYVVARGDNAKLSAIINSIFPD